MIDRERLALLLMSIKTGVDWPNWTNDPRAEEFRATGLAYADRILSDIAEQGYVIVPKAPTWRMIDAGNDCYSIAPGTESWAIAGCKGADVIYTTMIAAQEE